MLIKSAVDIRPSEITPESVYRDRRQFMTKAAQLGMVAGLTSLAPGLASAAEPGTPAARRDQIPDDMLRDAPAPWWRDKFSDIAPVDRSGTFFTDENLTPFRDIATYNNYYEFGLDKQDPYRNSQNLKVDPWSVEVSGECDKPGRYYLEDFLKPQQLEERIYRLRCVERWSMVIPWVGFPLADLIKRMEPNSRARYVAFETLQDEEQMPALRSRFSIIDWPYREGLRMDEATHPLAFLAVGLYGNYMPPQNGAPIRLVVPWKYGFKSVKSIVRIRFTETEPETTWNLMQPHEYGFYANVNPEVHHPRWRQDVETRLPRTIFSSANIPTRLFNGYADQVAHMYEGMDLARFY